MSDIGNSDYEAIRAMRESSRIGSGASMYQVELTKTWDELDEDQREIMRDLADRVNFTVPEGSDPATTPPSFDGDRTAMVFGIDGTMPEFDSRIEANGYSEEMFLGLPVKVTILVHGPEVSRN